MLKPRSKSLAACPPLRPQFSGGFSLSRMDTLSLGIPTVTNAAALCFLAYLLSQGVDAVLFLGIVAVLTGLSTPPLGASMRVLWASVTPAGPIRTRAYSVDAVAEELTFTTGPVITAAIIAATSPLAGLLEHGAVVLASSEKIRGCLRGSHTKKPPPGGEEVLLVAVYRSLSTHDVRVTR